MPIYAYRCDACGHRQDVLQKMSDPTLTVCPACNAAAFARQLSAPAFQLKGTGWYVTDFRDNGKKAGGDAAKPAAGNGAPAEEKSNGASDAKSDGGKSDGGKSDAAAAGKSGGESTTPAAIPAASADKPGGTAGTTTGGTGAS